MNPPPRVPPAYVWLRPPAELAWALDAHRRHWWWPAGSHFPPPHRLHLTLQALGPLEDAELQQVAHALSGVQAPAFELELAWSGVWTGNAIAVARPRAHPGLTQLHAALSQRLRGRTTARNWSPHVTLAWGVPRAGAAPLPPMRWSVREFLLVRSWMQPGEMAKHEVLNSYALSPPPPAPTATRIDTPCHPDRHTAFA